MKITDYLAIYAAILSTLVFIWTVAQTRPKIKADLLYGSEGTGDTFQSGVYIFVRNLSAYDVHLVGVRILYRYKRPAITDHLSHLWRFKSLRTRIGWVQSALSNYSIDDGCPITLGARKQHKVFISNTVLDEIFGKAVERTLIASVQDQLWKDVYSHKFKC
jgi:hypothetical protein